MFFQSSLLVLAVALFLGANAFSGKTCRIMRLGASITNVAGSSRGNGYRDDLYNLLLNDGSTVNLVCSQKAGDFPHPFNEGYPGAVLTEVNALGQDTVPYYRPKIATILAGTNDAVFKIDSAGMPDRLYKVIDDILNWPWLIMVVVATLPPNGNLEADQLVDANNSAMPGVVQRFNDQGRWVVLADIRSVVELGDLVDGTHPNDAAYERMVRNFYEAIQLGESRG